jgi:hypothetical protein
MVFEPVDEEIGCEADNDNADDQPHEARIPRKSGIECPHEMGFFNLSNSV